MKLTDIVVPNCFLNTTPRASKLIEINKYYNKFGQLDKPIVINKDGMLLDGYARYIVAIRMGLTDVPVVIGKKKQKSVYVSAAHKRNCKRYWWKVRKGDEEEFLSKIRIGSPIMVDTKKGVLKVFVTSISIDKRPPVSGEIKYVVKF